MKTIKSLIIAAAALFIAGNVSAATLNATNGLAAGKALLALYTQYKADGKMDLSNTTNINNIVSLVSNIQGLTGKSTSANTSTDFLSSLISGSKNLVTEANSNSVLSALGSIANLDTSAIAKSVATSAATSALGKLVGGSKTTTDSSSAASTAASVLTNLFSSLKK